MFARRLRLPTYPKNNSFGIAGTDVRMSATAVEIYAVASLKRDDWIGIDVHLENAAEYVDKFLSRVFGEFAEFRNTAWLDVRNQRHHSPIQIICAQHLIQIMTRLKRIGATTARNRNFSWCSLVVALSRTKQFRQMHVQATRQQDQPVVRPVNPP